MRIVIVMLFLMWLGGGCALSRLVPGKGKQPAPPAAPKVPAASKASSLAAAAEARIPGFDAELAKDMLAPVPGSEHELDAFAGTFPADRCNARSRGLLVERREGVREECRGKYHPWLHAQWTAAAVAAIARGEGTVAHWAARELMALMSRDDWRGPREPPVDLARRGADVRALEAEARFAREGSYAAPGSAVCVPSGQPLPGKGKLVAQYHFEGDDVVRVRCYLPRRARELASAIERPTWTAFARVATGARQGQQWSLEVDVPAESDRFDLELPLSGKPGKGLSSLQIVASLSGVVGTQERWDESLRAVVRTPLVQRTDYQVTVTIMTP